MSDQTIDLSIGQALDLGVQYAMAGDHRSAAGLFMGVLKHEPLNFEAMERLGSSLFESRRYHEALYWFWRGRKQGRRHPMALTNYGLCLSQLGHPDEGLPELERAAYHAEREKRCSPQVKALVYNNLGNTLLRLERHTEALAALDKGIAYDPGDPFPHYNRGIALLRLNRHRAAITALDMSLELRAAPADSGSRLNHSDALYNRAMVRMLLGDLKGGFADYDARLTTSENNTLYLGLPPETMWNGEDIAGKTILVHCEQGLGDDVQFFRFLPALAATGATVLVVSHKETKPLLEGLPVTALTQNEPMPPYDVWVPLMSLPNRLGLDEADRLPPPWFPPIEADRMALECAAVLRSDRINVGVAWAGNWLHKNNAHRSIPLAQFAELFDAMGCNFVSLQQMQPIDTEAFVAINAKRSNLSALYLADLRDTAAVISRLDLVISVDTAVAHIAASLGTDTRILIPAYSTDWRWQLIREDSPWYPSARLYRQPKVGDWASVLTRLRGDLSAIAAQRAAA